jgi:16S rRNA (guanine966-N2)-methyltransferase
MRDGCGSATSPPSRSRPRRPRPVCSGFRRAHGVSDDLGVGERAGTDVPELDQPLPLSGRVPDRSTLTGMRVIAGELGGRRLRAVSSTGVRPTADRVREAVFSILGEIGGARVLDLYSGTGALAIEAVSRGAARAVLVDTQPATARRNVEALGISDRCSVVRADVVRYVGSEGSRFDLVFCDPPYKLADRLGPELTRLIPDRLAEGGRVIVESDVRQPLHLELPVQVERRYGDTLIRVHGRTS